MAKIFILFLWLTLYVNILPQTHVFWYNAISGNYNLTADDPGPGLPPGATIHEGMIASGHIHQKISRIHNGFAFGNGLDMQQGRSGFFWSRNLNAFQGKASSAKLRGEYRDGWSGNAYCNAGPINVKIAVVDYQNNIDYFGGVDRVSTAAGWMDPYNPLRPAMTVHGAQEMRTLTAPEGRASESGPSKLDGQFFEIDVTDQVNFILSNPGQWAIVFLVDTGQAGGTGKINIYSAEQTTAYDGDPSFSDNPWTTDGNTMHLVLELASPPVSFLIPIESPTENRRPIFSWYPVEGVSSYTLLIDTDPSFLSPITVLPTSDTSYVPTVDLPVDTIYWRVLAENRAYPAVSSFIIQNPKVPEIIPYKPDPTAETRPTLQWHSVQGASFYRIVIDLKPDFSNPEVSVTTSDTFFNILADLPIGMVYWKVKSNLSDTYSSFDSFRIQPEFISGTHVFWYKAITNGYTVTDCNPGPCVPAGAIIQEGIIATGTVAQHSGSSEATLVFGSGLDDQQGRCGFIWSKDLQEFTGHADQAHVRAEHRNNWSGGALSNSGPINIRCGVVDFQGNLDAWGSAEYVPETADWQDFLNPLSSSMGYDFMTPTLAAEEIIPFTAPAGRPDEFSGSTLDGVFMEVDITDQVNWILEHEGSYAVVLLVPPNEGNTGKVMTYSMEDGTGLMGLGSDNPWTTDGNTAHILVKGDLVSVENPVPPCQAVSTGLLGPNMPNPFNPSTRIPYNTGKAGRGIIRIFSIDGRLVFEKNVKGSGFLEWNAHMHSSGIYLLKAKIGKKLLTQRLILQK